MNEVTTDPLDKHSERKTTGSTKSRIKRKFRCAGKLRRNQAERVHLAMRPVLLVAQCIGIFPIIGIRGPNYSHLRYFKFSAKSIVSMFLLTVASSLSIPTVILIMRRGLNYRTAGDIMFCSSSALSMIAFYKLAGRWKTLMERWSAVEDAMLGLPCINVSGKITILTAYVVCASLCEHIMAVLFNQSPCVSGWEQYYKESFRQVFSLTEYAIWKGMTASLLNFFMASTWNFTDLFLMTLSMALSARFKQLNLELESVIHLDVEANYWTKMRETYNKLALLTKLVDENVSLLVLISFTNNLFFICLQLLHSMEPIQSIPKMIYSIISFSHLLFRACSVCLTAADVYDSSKAPLSILFSVPSSTYNIEVQRMTLQVAFENLSLTGCRFFYVTRTLMLTVAGTIVTYEIVLLQFSKISSDYSQSFVVNCSEFKTLE